MFISPQTFSLRASSLEARVISLCIFMEMPMAGIMLAESPE